jgi:hypothetical protein
VEGGGHDEHATSHQHKITGNANSKVAQSGSSETGMNNTPTSGLDSLNHRLG